MKRFLKIGAIALVLLRGLDSRPAAADTSAAHLARAEALASKSDLDGAIGEYRKAIQLKPRSAVAESLPGCTLRNLISLLNSPNAIHRQSWHAARTKFSMTNQSN